MYTDNHMFQNELINLNSLRKLCDCLIDIIYITYCDDKTYSPTVICHRHKKREKKPFLEIYTFKSFIRKMSFLFVIRSFSFE